MKEVKELGETEWDSMGYGSMGMNFDHSAQDQNDKFKIQLQKTDDDKTQILNGSIPLNKYKRFQLEEA